MNQVWDDSIGFIRRESALLVPLALATLYIGDVVTGLASAARTGTDPRPLATFAILAGAIWSIVGQLSIVSLVLMPGQSVGEALRHGVSRLGKVLLIALLLGVVVATAMLPLAVAAVASGADPTDPASLQNLPGWVELLLVVVLAALVWLGIRLALMNALIVDRNPGVVDAIRRSFALTRGIAARLFLVVALYLIVLAIVSSAVRFVAGTGFTLLGSVLESPFSAMVLTALVSGLVSTSLSLVATVFLAMLYRRVISGT